MLHVNVGLVVVGQTKSLCSLREIKLSWIAVVRYRRINSVTPFSTFALCKTSGLRKDSIIY